MREDRVGRLICWENRMPLARREVYLGGVHVHVAPTAAPQDFPGSALPAAGPLYDAEGVVGWECDLRRAAARQALVRRGGPPVA